MAFDYGKRFNSQWYMLVANTGATVPTSGWFGAKIKSIGNNVNAAKTSTLSFLFVVAVCLYAFAWGVVFYAGSNISKKGTPSKYLVDRLAAKELTPCSAAAPDDVFAFLVFTFLVFSSFALWHLLHQCNVGTRRSELGYMFLSAVAKTTLHGFLAVTVLARSDIGCAEDVTTAVLDEMPNTYATGFGIAGGAIVFIAIGFALICRCAKDKSGYEAAPVHLWEWYPVRWVDYVVSAPLMYSVLAVSWGMISSSYLFLGALCHAIAIDLAGITESPKARETTGLSYDLYRYLHAFCACVHMGSAAVIFILAAATNRLTNTVCVQWDWHFPPRNRKWYYAVDGVDTFCDEAAGESNRLIIDYSREHKVRTFNIVAPAVVFAAWSGLCHVYAYRNAQRGNRRNG